MKNVGKRLCAFLLVAVIAVGLLPTAAFALGGQFGTWFSTGPATVDENLIPYLKDVIDAANIKIGNQAKIGYAEKLGDTSLQSTITITKSNVGSQEFLTTVVGEILEALHNASATDTSAVIKVKPCSPDPSTCLPGNPSTCLPGTPQGNCMSSDGTLTLSGLTGDRSNRQDSAYISDFCSLTGLMTASYNTAGDFDAVGFGIEMTCADLNNLKATCTFVFVLPKLEAKPEEDGKLTIDPEKQQVSGTDLVNNESASGKTVDEVKALFKDVTGDAEIKIMQADGQTEITDSTAHVGTGCVVELIANGSVLDRVVVIVTGDTDGDGKIGHVDAQKVLNDVAGVTALDGVYATAGHMKTQEGALSHIDAQMILNIEVEAAA